MINLQILITKNVLMFVITELLDIKEIVLKNVQHRLMMCMLIYQHQLVSLQINAQMEHMEMKTKKSVLNSVL